MRTDRVAVNQWYMSLFKGHVHECMVQCQKREHPKTPASSFIHQAKQRNKNIATYMALYSCSLNVAYLAGQHVSTKC